MELRDWVRDRFGSAETETLLDESVYGKNELRTDKKKIEQSLKQLERTWTATQASINNCLRREPRQMRCAGDSMRRRRSLRKEVRNQKKKHKANSIKLGTVISIEGMRDVMDMHESQDLSLDEAMSQDLNVQEVQGEIMDQMAQFGLELEDMQQVQDALDIEILDDDLEQGASEELEAMERMAAGEISSEQVNVEEDVEVDADEISIDADIEDEMTDTDMF